MNVAAHRKIIQDGMHSTEFIEVLLVVKVVHISFCIQLQVLPEIEIVRISLTCYFSNTMKKLCGP